MDIALVGHFVKVYMHCAALEASELAFSRSRRCLRIRKADSLILKIQVHDYACLLKAL